MTNSLPQRCDELEFQMSVIIDGAASFDALIADEWAELDRWEREGETLEEAAEGRFGLDAVARVASDNREHWIRRRASTFRAGLFALAFANVEDCLMLICHDFEPQVSPLTVKDIAREGLDRAKIFLRKAVGLNFPDSSLEWADLQTYRRIRNSVMHRGGRIRATEDEKPILQLQRKARSFLILSDGSIVFGERFLEAFQATVVGFASHIRSMEKVPIQKR